MNEDSTMEDKRKPHRCTHESCNASFDRPYRLAQHLLVHDKVKAYACTEENCSKSYTNKSHLDRHIASVHKSPDNVVLYRCPTCLQRYANRQNLKRHIKITHKLKTMFTCDICKVDFNKKHQLTTHMHSHTGIEAFSCEICPRKFVSLFEKKKHARHHKVHSCKKCPLKFSLWSKYIKHNRAAHLLSEYICNECNRSFKQRSHIVRHMKIHSSTTVFRCTYDNCKRTYSRNSNLKQHILMKHVRLTFACSVCEAQLSTKAKLGEHISKLHGSSEPKQLKPKTKATGRKPRKDEGVPKKSIALKLAGLLREPENIESPAEKVAEIPCILNENMG